MKIDGPHSDPGRHGALAWTRHIRLTVSMCLGSWNLWDWGAYFFTTLLGRKYRIVLQVTGSAGDNHCSSILDFCFVCLAAYYMLTALKMTDCRSVSKSAREAQIRNRIIDRDKNDIVACWGFGLTRLQFRPTNQNILVSSLLLSADWVDEMMQIYPLNRCELGIKDAPTSQIFIGLKTPESSKPG